MRALILRPDPTELPGLVGKSLVAHGFELVSHTIVSAERYLTPNVEADLPALDGFDLVVLLGAPWGAWDDDTIGPWLGDLLETLRQAQNDDVPVLGICFGGQALARALGGTVAPGPEPEIGWVDIESDRPDLFSNGPWFQWHYDRFTPPPQATEIARNAAASQAFVIGRSMGVQFHPEVDAAELQGWLDLGGHGEALSAGFDPDVLVADTERNLVAGEQRTHQLVTGFLQHVAKLI